MDAAERYHYADFTRANYRRLLRLAKERYRFRTFTDFDREERFVLWRHDVDASVHSALRLAEIESGEGVVSTYFLHLHSAFYNLLERPVAECVTRILQGGHRLGLHFDASYYGARAEHDLEALLAAERRLLGEAFGADVDVFSFHNPDAVTLGFVEWSYAGMVNTYARYFREEVGYCSDSNGYWRFRRLEDVLDDGTDQRLQVLTHPEWWQERPMPPRERVQRCIDGRARRTGEAYDAVLRGAGRENVGSDTGDPERREG
jgi:hypothetical protein